MADTEVHLPSLYKCEALLQLTSRVARSLFHCMPLSALQMYMTLQLSNLHLRCALLQFSFSSFLLYFLSINLKNSQPCNRNPQNNETTPPTTTVELGLVYIPVCQIHQQFWRHCPFQLLNSNLISYKVKLCLSSKFQS